MYRQGDVILIPSTRKPSKAAKRILDNGRTILAYGEVTGHCHEVIALKPVPVTHPGDVPAQELFEEPDGTRLLVCKVPCELRHDEHGTIALGGDVTFEVRRQTEWSLDQARQVAD